MKHSRRWVKSGLNLQLRQHNGLRLSSDVRTSRLAAWYVRAGTPPAALLEPGPFQAIAEGYLRTDHKGRYQFSLLGSGEASLTINGQQVLAEQTLHAAAAESVEVALHKGYNGLRIAYNSPPQTDAALRLQWSGPDFEPELVPADRLLHDSRDADLALGMDAPAGRDLFAMAGLAHCHRPAVQAAGDVQPELAPPGPSLAGAALLHPEWFVPGCWLRINCVPRPRAHPARR